MTSRANTIPRSRSAIVAGGLRCVVLLQLWLALTAGATAVFGDERPEILARGSQGRNKLATLVLICGVGNGIAAGTAPLFEALFAIQAMLRVLKMKKPLCFVCCALAGIKLLHFPAFAETAKPNSTAAPAAISAPLKTNGQSSKKTEKDCEDEWRADRERMMKYGMTEESYVEQCSVSDDVPAIPSEPKTNSAPPAAPK